MDHNTQGHMQKDLHSAIQGQAEWDDPGHFSLYT